MSPREIRGILADNSEAESLFDRVCDFYGDKLKFINKTDGGPVGGANFNIGLDSGDESDLSYAEIAIDVAHQRAVKSLVHELLHLELRIVGFPVINSAEDRVVDQAGVDLVKLHGFIFNTVDHYLFKERFVEIGFLPSEIVPDPKANREKYLKEWIVEFRDCGYENVSAIRCADHMYFIGWVLDELRGQSNEARICLDFFKRYVPGFEERMGWLPIWFGRREFMDPLKHGQSLCDAVNKMKIPVRPLYRLSKMGGVIRATRIYCDERKS